MTNDAITALPIEQLHESPFNPRKTFASAGLQELADSIRAVGVQQPIKVRPVAGGEAWEVVFGHRRLRAAVLAGLASMPCMVCTMTDAEAARAQIAENLEREDLHPIEEAEGYAALMQDHGVTADELVQQTGKSRSYIYGRLKLLQACPQIRNACLAGEIGSEVALLIARLRTDKLQADALAHIKNRGTNLSDGGSSSFRQIRYDTRPLLDSREQGPQDIEQHAQALLYGAMRGLLRHHATQVHLVHLQQHDTGT
jgi:ParB/RepB/Spo0J family partition protein